MTPKLTSPKIVSEIMKRHQVKFTKSLGQNFLIDENIVNKITCTAQLAPDDTVLEIGPGIGTLTTAMALRAKKVVAIEIDRGMIPILMESTADLHNVNVIEGDVLKADFTNIAKQNIDGGPFKVISNLPYNITTPVIIKLLTSKLPIRLMVFMVQNEVARRMAAIPGSKEYGALSVAVQFCSTVSTEFRVPPSAFMPRPKVDSAVVKLIIRAEPPVYVKDRELFFKVVRLAFGYRRKTLANALSMGDLRLDREHIGNVLTNLGINPQRRGETLKIPEFAMVSNALKGCDFNE